MRVVLYAALGLALIAGFVFVITRIDQGDLAQARAAQLQWFEFSAAHHCRIKQPGSFGHPAATWSCDGFDVYHEE